MRRNLVDESSGARSSSPLPLHWVNVSLGPCANSDLEAVQMLAKVSMMDQALALGQSEWVPLLCLGPRVLPPVLVWQAEKLMRQTVSVFARVRAALQQRPRWDHRAT